MLVNMARIEWHTRIVAGILLLFYLTLPSNAHEHHQSGPADESIPIDWILWLHIAIQSTAWFILFPLATVFGLTRHRLHVPTAVLALVLTSAGYIMGHKHGGRNFPHTAHGTVAELLIYVLIIQASLGTYLKLHLRWKVESRIRPIILYCHSFVGKTFAVLGWLQMLLGVITLRSWCRGGATGQCLAHYIMGSAFIGYGIILLIMLKAGVDWLKRRNMSQEMLDSTVIFCWGCVNALTEHHGGPWNHKDLQHTMLGVVWVAGGAAGMWVSRKGKRSVFPSVVIVLTGWAMSGHAQALMLSTMIHALFGYTLMGMGAARIIEVCFVLEDKPTGLGEDSRQTHGQWFPIRAFQYLPTWLLFASGVLFMSATDEELRWADGNGVDHITWGLIDYSLSFIIFLWANVLIDFYTSQGGYMGSRLMANSTSNSGLELARGITEYDRLSLDDSSQERTAIESGTNSHDSLEMSRVKPTKRSSPPSYETQSPHHVLFDEQEEEEEEADPFEDR